MTLQDRAAQWLKTVEETWTGTTEGPWKAEPVGPHWFITGPENGYGVPDVLDGDASPNAERNADAAAKSPTHLSEGQALVRELLAEVERHQDAPPPADAALLALANRAMAEQNAAKDERIAELELENRAFLATQGRVEHAIAVTLGEYAWEPEDYDRFFELFRFYLIPSKPRTPEEMAQDRERAKQYFYAELKKYAAQTASEGE